MATNLGLDDRLILAASCWNLCRKRGVTGNAVDLLLCAVAIRRDLTVFTTDDDFSRCASRVPVRLHPSS